MKSVVLFILKSRTGALKIISADWRYHIVKLCPTLLSDEANRTYSRIPTFSLSTQKLPSYENFRGSARKCAGVKIRKRFQYRIRKPHFHTVVELK